MPHLSVQMTAYDASATISSAIRSTLFAMPRDAELVVLDDGSDDATAAVAEAIPDRRLRVIRGAANEGYARARRRLLAETDSAVVAVMDADDVSLPWRFAVQLPALRRADLVVAPVVRFTRRPWRLSPGLPLAITAEAMALHLVIGCPLAHPTLVARRSAVEAAGGYQDAVAEDYDLYLRCIASGGRLLRVGVPTLAYRNHAAQASRDGRFDERMAEDAGFQESVDRFLLRRFGLRRAAHGTPMLPVPELDALLEREIGLLDRAQAWQVRRYRRRGLGAVAAGADAEGGPS